MDEFKLYMMKDKGWSSDHYDKVLFEFDRFITLYYEDDNISPNVAIDTFWHELLLETRLYHDYCHNKFGCYVHHSLLRSQDNNWKSRYQRTITNYKNKYGTVDDQFWHCTIADDNSNNSNGSNTVNLNNVSSSEVITNPNDVHYVDLIKDLSDQPHFPVIIKSLTGREYVIQTCDNMTIYHLKYLIDSIGNMARLIFDLKELDNKKIIKDYNITSGSTINMVLKLC